MSNPLEELTKDTLPIFRPISMYEALSTFENDPKGFTVEEIKAKAGVMWNQELWDWLVKESFDLDNEDQSPRLPRFDQSLGRWLYIP